MSSVTAVEWSLNGMKLFSGDKNGLVVLTQIDFYMVSAANVNVILHDYIAKYRVRKDKKSVPII